MLIEVYKMEMLLKTAKKGSLVGGMNKCYYFIFYIYILKSDEHWEV